MSDKTKTSLDEGVTIHLQDIERPEYMGKRVRIPVIIAGVAKAFSIPGEGRARCGCNGEDDILCFEGWKTVDLGKSPNFWLKCIGKDDDKVRTYVRYEVTRVLHCPHPYVRFRGYQTCTQVVVCPEFHELVSDTVTGKIVDEMGRDWKRVHAVYLGTVEAKSQPYIVEATVVAHPQTQEITLVIDRLEPVDSGDSELEPVELSYEELEQLIGQLERHSAVKGRRDAHFWTLLIYSTPAYFYFDGERVEGWGKGLFFGDSTTGKGQSAKSILRLLHKGKYVVAETGSRAGLLYGIEQVAGTHILVWGALPQSDGGLIIIDGSNKMPPKEWGEFLEAVRTGMLEVNRIENWGRNR